jgi:hypothetical protein
MKRSRAAVLISVCAAIGSPAGAQEVRLQEVPAIAGVPIAELKPRVVIFSEQPSDKPGDPSPGLIAFDEWARTRPVQRRMLSLFQDFAEPVVKGGTKRTLSIYVAEARFQLPKPARAYDLSRYANIAFLERVDPVIKHHPIGAADAVPNKKADASRPPGRNWCDADGATCIQSRYHFEGKIPSGILLANKLRDETKTPIPDFIEFQSEIRLISPQQPEFAALASLTGLNAAVTGALEQNIFWFNQVMQFGKLLAVLQQHPVERDATVATVYVVVAVRDDVLSKQRDYVKAPILRNLVPAQLLMGRSSFNAGNSISAGLPNYARSRIKAIADILDRE